MQGFKSFSWVCLILGTCILSMAIWQPATPNYPKHSDHEIHDTPGEQQGYQKNAPIQKLSGHDFRVYRPDMEPARHTGKPVPYINSTPKAGGGDLLLPSQLRHYAGIIPSQTGRTLIYPFHSFM